MSDDDEVPVKELRVHADTFEYTREGLQSREAIPLRTARRNKIIVVRPERQLGIGYGAAGFVLDSSFPLPASLEKFWTFAPRSAAFAHPQEPVESPPDGYFQVYAHSSVSGDEASNKTLSDRRAAVGRALLVGDVAAVQAAADEEGWGLAEVQAMLRMLACDPGPIDGQTGDLTTTAITQFQERYNRGIYHRRAPQAPASELEPDGEWNLDTRDAVIEAFVAAHAVHLPVDRLHPTHPANGCSEYNLLSPDDPAANRRVTLLRHPELPVHHDNAPCERGNEAACAIVDDRSQRCMWFREHVIEDESGPIYFYDPRWLWLGKNRYLLSAITNARADDEVTFEVFEREEPGAEEEDPDPFSTSRSEEVRALWRHGIVQVVWVAPAAALDERGRPALDGTPLFRVRHAASGVWTSATWPEVVTARILVGAVGAGRGSQSGASRSGCGAPTARTSSRSLWARPRPPRFIGWPWSSRRSRRRPCSAYRSATGESTRSSCSPT